MIRRRIVHKLLRSVKTYSKMNGHLLLALLSVWCCVFPFSSAMKTGTPIKGKKRGLVTIYGETMSCNGVTLNRNWVLTAGKCIDDSVLSSHRLSFRGRGGTNIDRTISHTERPENSEDIVLIKITKALKKRIRKVVMLQDSAPEDYRNCKLYTTNFIDQRVYTRLTNVNASCDNEAYNGSLCFDTADTICSDDSGSPIWCRTSKSMFLAGVLGTPDKCIMSGVSGIRIAFHAKWIQKVLNPVDCGAPPTISNGQLVLFEQGKTTSGAKASVNCDLGYTPTAIEVSCGDDGNWILAQCLLSTA